MTPNTVFTGYPSIDKPWLRYYNKEASTKPLPEYTLYDYLWMTNKDHQSDIAIEYYGKRVTYGEMFQNIDSTTKVLLGLGVKKGERILYLLPNIPETAYFLYAGSRLGSVADYMDPRPESVDLKVSALKILSMIQDEKIDYIVALDLCYLLLIKPIENELKEYNIKSIVIVSADNSMDIHSNLSYLSEQIEYTSFKEALSKLNDNKSTKKQLLTAFHSSILPIRQYKDLITTYKSIQLKTVPYEKNQLCVIVHTSGTTNSKPKPIPLTSDNINAYVHQSFYANMPMKRGDRALHILPYFAAFGLVNVAHNLFCRGNCLIQIPEFSPKNLGKMIKRYRPQTVIGTPPWLLYLISDPALTNADLSCLTMITYGGDSLNADDENKINNFLKSHKCKTVLTKGHGMSETCGCASFANHMYNHVNTVGIPLPQTIYAIVDPDTKQLVKFNENAESIEGELIISSQAVTNGILDGKVIVPHIAYDGIDYINSRDIVRMYRDGSVMFLSRSDRSFTRFDGYKIKPYEVEEVIKQHSKVENCIISSFFDEKNHGIMPIAHIITTEKDLNIRQNKVVLAKDIIDQCFIKNPDVSSRQIPARINFCDSFPITKNGKTDFKSMNDYHLSGEEIKVEIEETNIKIGEIKIY